MRSHKTIEMAEVALMSAVLCIVAPVAIPIPASPVPLSLATFAVYLAAVLLGAKKSAFCVLVYLLLGMVGLPVFSGFSGGIGVLLGPTGGYLVGYLPCALLIGHMAEARCLDKLLCRKQFFKNMLAMALGTLGCYLLGTLWFLAVMGGSYSLMKVLFACVVPYLPLDLIKILAVAAMAGPIRKMVRRRG